MGDAPWEAFDRGSPAGRALYALYNGNKDTKEAGKKFSQKNREAFKNQTPKTLEETLAAEKERKKQASQKPVVEYPKVAVRKTPSVAPVELLRGRKSEAVIRDEMQAEGGQVAELPKKKVLGEQEKQHLADMMEWRGKPPPKEVLAPPPPRKKTEVEEMEELFSLLMSEIEDRKQFLDEMEAAGRRDQYEARINGEIAQRIKQLEKLDKHLKAHDL
eukprot:jgi/Mesvir1/28075/Mv04668-RA.1